MAEIIMLWIVGSVMNFCIAGEKNRSRGLALVLSLLISPLPVYLYLLAVPVLPKH